MSIPFTTASGRLYYTNRAPTNTDDITQGFEFGNWWRDTSSNNLYICRSENADSAVWDLIFSGA